MTPIRNDVAAKGRALLEANWTRGKERLDGAQTELSVCLELFEVDLTNEAPWCRRHFYEHASPRRQFRIFLAAMKLPESGSSDESDLSGLCFAELELVWLALHLDYLAAGCASIYQEPSAGGSTSARHVHMILMHLLTRSSCSE